MFLPAATVSAEALWLRQDKFTRTTEFCGGKETAWSVSQGESTLTLALIGFYWLNLHRNTGCVQKAHQSLSVRNDQTIDNIQRTVRAYSCLLYTSDAADETSTV